MSAGVTKIGAALVPACAILAAVDELRQAGALEQFPDALAAGRPAWLRPDWRPGAGAVGFCDVTLRAVFAAGLIDVASPAGGRRRASLRAPEIVRRLVGALEAEDAQAKDRQV